MSDLFFKRSRRDGKDASQYINICKSNVEISRNIGLNLTYFLTSNNIIGLRISYYISKLQKTVLLIKSYYSWLSIYYHSFGIGLAVTISNRVIFRTSIF